MNKNILLAALRSVFSATEEELNSLLEVVNATPNSEMAMEKLLGTYQEIDIPTTSMSTSYGVLTLTKYDPWNKIVDYTKQVQKEITIYVADNNQEIITVENYQDHRVPYGRNTKRVQVTLNVYETREDSCSLSWWLEGAATMPKTPRMGEIDYNID